MQKQYLVTLIALIITSSIHAGPVIPPGNADETLRAKTILMDSVDMETSEGPG